MPCFHTCFVTFMHWRLVLDRSDGLDGIALCGTKSQALSKVLDGSVPLTNAPGLALAFSGC